MGRLTAAQKEEKVAEAVSMSLRGATYSEIAHELDIERKTAGEWIKAYYAKRAEHRDNELEEAIAFYEELIAERFKRLSQMPTDSRANNVVGLLNGLNADRSRIDVLKGLEAARKHEHSGPDGGPIQHAEVNDETAAMLDALALRKAKDGEDGPASN